LNNNEIKEEPAIRLSLAGRWWHAWSGRSCFACVFVLLADRGLAQSTAPQTSTPASMELNLEDLINVQVTSVSKKEEKLTDAAAAISVLSNDDLRRSGATSIAEALRLIPGMDVAQVNSGSWAISVRGFNEIFSRSLLVLVDGRTVYTPQDGGVAWDLQQQMLEDLDRVEVIRGPGGTLWGANAVNGVINIVSKSARDTQGTLLYGSGGSAHYTMDGGRYGGKLDDNTYYRVFGSYRTTLRLTRLAGVPP
jgi:iron complex outermembrane receptor protein